MASRSIYAPLRGLYANASESTLGVMFGLAAALMWASYLSFARAGISTGLQPQDFVLLRFGVAGLVMLPWLLRNRSELSELGWRKSATIALLAGPLFVLLGVGGYRYAPLAHGVVFQPATITLVSMVLGLLLFGESFGRYRAIGVALMLAGLTAIASPWSAAAGPAAWLGDLSFASAGALWALFTLLIKRWSIAALTATAVVSVLSAVVTLPVYLAFSNIDRLAALDLRTLLTQVVVQGIFSGVLAVIAYGRAVRYLGPSRAGAFPALVPAVALFLGIPVAGEVPTCLEVIGATLVCVGLAYSLKQTA